MSDRADHLLFAMSSRGTASWQGFKDIYATLQRHTALAAAEGENGEASNQIWQCVRGLQALGHCDFDFSDRGAVYVAPPVLARLPRGGAAAAVLVGSRTPDLLNDLAIAAARSNVSVEIGDGPAAVNGAPRRVVVEGLALTSLRDIAGRVGVRFEEQPPAWKIAQYSGSVDEYMQSLEWLPATPPPWAQVAFDPRRLAFAGFYDPTDVLRLAREDRFGRWEYSLWANGQRAGADLDWARFAIVNTRRQQVLAYDIRRAVLVAVAGIPVPFPLCRALALCSGSGPQRAYAPSIDLGLDAARRTCDFYYAVPPEIASVVFDKLGQHPYHISILP